MKKRLLLSLMAACVSLAGFALNEGEYIYTPQGRFLITGANQNANSAFSDFTGWSVVSASTEKTVNDQFTINANGYAEGINSIVSLDATAGEGIKYKFEPAYTSSIYVVSYKMKGAQTVTVRAKEGATISKLNVARVAGYDGEGTRIVTVSTGEELSDEWQTFNYAILPSEVALTYWIEFSGMANNIEIADVQIAEATQVADFRQRDAMLNKLKAYRDCYNWEEEVLEDYSLAGEDNIIDQLNSITENSTQEELDEKLGTAADILNDFFNTEMDDYLAGRTDSFNYLGINKTGNNLQKTAYGDWKNVDRAYWSKNAYPDLGHYQKGSSWAYGNPDNAIGIYIQKDFSVGSYVFDIEAAAALRENVSQSWDIDEGMQAALGIAYVVKVVDGVATDTIVKQEQDLHPVNYKPFTIVAKVTEDGTYEIGFKAYCKGAYKSLNLGSVVFVRNARIYGKNGNLYNQTQLRYEADVREQINTGRTQLNTAADNLQNEELYWGKSELQACVDTIRGKIETYEALSQADIIETFDPGVYVKSTSDVNGLMVYEVYQNAVKDIIAANRKFAAVNDTLASIQSAIDVAEETLKLRLYDAATGKADLESAISTAKELQTQMKNTDYSVENAATIVAAVEALNGAIAEFKASVPATAMTTIVDIDFENKAVVNEGSGLYEIAGATGVMSFSRFWEPTEESSETDGAFEQGFWISGEHVWAGYLRVGNGEGTVTFDPTSAREEGMGTDILKINCDFFLQGLSNRFVGFLTKDAESNNVASFYANYYDNTIDAQSNLDIELGSLKYASGSNYDNGNPEGAEPTNKTALAKNSFEVILDYGEGSMYCTTTSAKGVVTTAKKAFDKAIPTQFILKSNYNNQNASRRCWFDNLKIQRVSAGPTEPFIDGVQELMSVETKVKMPSKVIKNGRLIINGKYGANGILIK